MVETGVKGKTCWYRTAIPSIPEAEGGDQVLDINLGAVVRSCLKKNQRLAGRSLLKHFHMSILSTMIRIKMKQIHMLFSWNKLVFVYSLKSYLATDCLVMLWYKIQLIFLTLQGTRQRTIDSRSRHPWTLWLKECWAYSKMPRKLENHVNIWSPTLQPPSKGAWWPAAFVQCN